MESITQASNESHILIESWKSETPEPKIHLLPFKISYDGTANIDTFFIPEKIPNSLEDGELNYKCSFRGRRLIGSELHVPSNYKGIIFRENENDKDNSFSIKEQDDSPKIWSVDRYFNKFVYWTRKPEVSYHDMPRRWLQWIELSSCIHKPVNEDDLSKPLKFVLNNKTNDVIEEKILNIIEDDDDDDDSNDDNGNRKKRKRDEDDNEQDTKSSIDKE